MECRIVDAQAMKSLEDYAVALMLGMISIQTLNNYHVRAVELGILKEDQECRANTIAWDLRRLMKLYRDQLESILELLPSSFNADFILDNLKKFEVKKAADLVKKRKLKDGDKKL